jgi:hypothetical protein
MNFLKLKILKNINFINYFLILIFFFYSIYVVRYQYDGHHIGLVYSNAIDLIKGKLPYKEIFIQYGFLTTLIHSLILLLFENKVFLISLFNIIFYSLGILFTSKTIKNLINKDYAFLGTIVILFNHPIPWLPWSNYIAFFFVSISLFLLSRQKIFFFLISLTFSLAILSRQDFFIPITFSFILFSIILLLSRTTINFTNILQILSGFFLPIIFFLIYLIFLDIYKDWLDYLILPKYYLEVYNTSLINLMFNYIAFFSIESFFNFIYTPQYFLISIILISNTVFIFLKIINKIKIPNNIFYIILLSLSLSLLSLKIELFRLYTSVIFGLIPLFYFLNKIEDADLKYNLKLLIILPSLYSIIFYPFGNNKQFEKLEFHTLNLKLTNSDYDYVKWPDTKVNTINLINNLSKKCTVQYLDNLSFDTFLSTIGNYDRIRLIPFEKKDLKDTNFHYFLDSIKNTEDNFIKLINKEIEKQNIIVLIDENNNVYKDNEIKFTPSYTNLKINESLVPGKPKILRVYFPSKCLN